MRLQRAPFLCGPLAILNGARALGIRLTEREIRLHTGTTKKDGTNAFGMLSALERLGLEFRGMNGTKATAFDHLLESIIEGYVGALCVEEGNHWIAAIGAVGNRIVTFDSWNSFMNKKECGVDVLNQKQLIQWWAHGPTNEYYGILFKKGPR